MAHTHPAAVTGLFYPGDAGELEAVVRAYLAAAHTTGPVPKAIIAPHAGYIYSGRVAACAYARLLPARERITRVVLLGPAHRMPVRGLAATSARAFATPLGTVDVDTAALGRALELPQVRILDPAHTSEHSLEVQLPFLQVVLARFSVVPLLVGEATMQEVSEVLETLWGGDETLIVISSDLSHYQDYNTARRIDEATSRAIEELRPQDIEYEQACGRHPIQGLLLSAQHHDLRAETVDLRNSGDTAGPRERVVGYGAYVFMQDRDAVHEGVV